MNRGPTKGERIIAIDVRTLMIGVALLLGSVAAVLLLMRLADILIVLVLALLLGEVLEPAVALLEKARVPRLAGVLLLYLSLLLTLVAAGFYFLPGLIAQLIDFITTLPVVAGQLVRLFTPLQEQIQQLATNLGITVDLQSRLGDLAGQIVGLLAPLFRVPVTIATVIFDSVLVLVMSVFWLIGKGKLSGTLFTMLTPKEARLLDAMFRDMSGRVGAWVRGQIILSAVIAIMSYVALTILGVQFSILLALFAGVMEIIPFLGPWLGGFPAVVVAFFQSPLLALEVIVAYVIIQQVEGHILVPKVMGQVVGLNPLVIIIVLLVGASLLGIMGAAIAVPVAAALQVMLTHLVIPPLQRRAEQASNDQ